MTIEHLRERLAYWQRVLRLQDWDIVLDFADQRDMPSMTHRGSLEAQWNYRRALIKIADPATTRFENLAFHQRFGSDDAEHTLVHELVHLILPSDGVPEDAEEYAVESLTKALLHLDRGIPNRLDVSTFEKPNTFVDGVPRVTMPDGRVLAAVASSLDEPVKRCTSCFQLFTARGSLCDRCAERLSSPFGVA